MELPMAPQGASAQSTKPAGDHHHHDDGHHGHDHGHSHGSETYDYEQLLGISVTTILGLASLYLYFSDRLFLILAQKFHIWVLVSGLGLLALTATRIWLLLSGHKGGTCSRDHGTHDHGSHEHHDGCCHGADSGHAHDHQGKGKHDHELGANRQHDHSHGKDHASCNHPAHDHSHGKDHASCNHPAHKHHGHTHTHGPTHDHGHSHAHAHDHGHDHSHGSGFLPLQTMILLSPIVLLLGLPGEVFNSAQALSASEVEASTRDVGDKGQDFEVTFLQLERAAANEETRNFYEGKTIRLTGRFVGDDDKRFTLIRYKINCCAADAVPLNSIIMVDPKYPERLPLQKLRNQWVEVTGKVQFLKKLGKEEYVSSLILHPEEGKMLDSIIKVVPPDANPYVN